MNRQVLPPANTTQNRTIISVAYRIKSRWHQSGRNNPSAVSLADNAGAMAYITWRLSLEGAKKLHGDGYDYLSDRQRVQVLSEFVAFLLQCADRLVYEWLDDEDRALFINAFAQRLADQMQDNLTDIAGPGNYRAPFIELLNERMEAYAEFKFRNEEPGYDFIRYFGNNVLEIMGKDQTNKWVINQVMEVDGPEVFKKFKNSLYELFDAMAEA